MRALLWARSAPHLRCQAAGVQRRSAASSAPMRLFSLSRSSSSSGATAAASHRAFSLAQARWCSSNNNNPSSSSSSSASPGKPGSPDKQQPGSEDGSDGGERKADGEGAAGGSGGGGGGGEVAAAEIRVKETPEELASRLQQLREVQRRFDLDAPVEMQMRQGGKLQTSDDLPPRYRFTAPKTVRAKMFDEQIARLEAIPDVKIVRGASGDVKIIDVPMDALTKAEIDHREKLFKRVAIGCNVLSLSVIAVCLAFLQMVWYVLSADPGPPPDEPIGAKVFLEVYQDDERVGTVVLGLYTERCPLTCENFHRLVTGNTPDGVSLRGTKFFDVFSKVGMVGGDYAKNSGSAARPVLPYFPGKRWFPDEVKGRDLPFFKGALCSVGSMYAKRYGVNDSTFMLSTAGTMKHNHSFPIFGEVLTGQDVIDTVCKKVKTKGTKPLRKVWIKNCGEYFHTPEERERANTHGPVILRDGVMV